MYRYLKKGRRRGPTFANGRGQGSTAGGRSNESTQVRRCGPSDVARARVALWTAIDPRPRGRPTEGGDGRGGAGTAPAADPTSFADGARSDGVDLRRAGLRTGGALTKADGKVTEVTKLQDIKMTKISLNMLWGMVAGFLVMFMQAGFAFVETGLCRAKNCRPHDGA